MSGINRQPFYYRVDGLLFTTTTGCSEQRLLAALHKLARSPAGRDIGLLAGSIEIEPNGYGEPDVTYVVQVSSGLQTGQWTAVTNTPLNIEDQFRVAVPFVPGEHRFYRLRK